MLLQGALKASRQLIVEIDQLNGEGIMEMGGRLRSMLLELMPPETSSADPALVNHLRSTGIYLYRTVTDACGKRDLEAAKQVVEFLEYELETWQQVVAGIDSTGPESSGTQGTNLAG